MAEQPALGFAGLLRQLRAEAGLTQEELAEAASVSPRSVSDLERGINRTARKDTAVLLAGALSLAEPVRAVFVAAARGRASAVEVLAAMRGAGGGRSPAEAGGVHGFRRALTSFIGRTGAVREVAGLLGEFRMVTVTGPGGVGKSRLAGEVAWLVADRFADGVWLADLAPAQDPAPVPAVVAAALGVRDQPGVPAVDALARVLARQQLLLVLDNCERVSGAVAELCAALLPAAGDVRVLVTSREPLSTAGEARYRLGPLTLPGVDGSAEAADVSGSEAVALFADRARLADPRFVLDDQTGPVVAQLVRRLEGMPLAIERAAAQVEALGVAQLPANPFTYGNPISDPRRFFGRAREVEQIFGRLRNEEFESSSVVGDRRIGKTSLLNYLADPSIRAAHGLEPEHYSFFYVDLQMVDEGMGPEQLWRRLLVLMRRQCAADGIARVLAALEHCDRLTTFDLDELFQEVDDNGLHVVFLLDEFERITGNPNFGPDFYYGLRSLMIRHKVALVTSSRLELIELCHSEAVKSSPFFNIFANINLRLFSHTDWQLMISRSLSGTGVRFSDAEMEQALDLAGLHPYFLQAACCMLYESHQMGLSDAARKDFLVGNFRSEAVPHITNYWDNSGDYEKIVLIAAALLEHSDPHGREFSLADLQRVFSRSESWVERLAKRGLLMPCGARYRLFSSAFGPWILHQIAVELSDELSYHEWLAENGLAERFASNHAALREILPKIGARYRRLIITWASDPQTFTAMAGLLGHMPTVVN